MLFFILKIEHKWIASNFFACTLKWKAPRGLRCVGAVSAGNAPSPVQQEACYRFCLAQRSSENRMGTALWTIFHVEFSVKMQGHIWAGERVLGQHMTQIYLFMRRFVRGLGWLAGSRRQWPAVLCLVNREQTPLVIPWAEHCMSSVWSCASSSAQHLLESHVCGASSNYSSAIVWKCVPQTWD